MGVLTLLLTLGALAPLQLPVTDAPAGDGSPQPSATPIVRQTPGGTLLEWDCPAPTAVDGLPDGLSGYTADGCGLSGEDSDVLLPATRIHIAVPPGAAPSLSVTASGTYPLPGGTVATVLPGPCATDSFLPADRSELPTEWGELVEVGTFRRAGMATVALRPVVSTPSGLVAATRLTVTLTHRDAGEPSPDRTGSGALFEHLLAGGNSVWSLPAGRTDDDGPFWGLPWYCVGVDTAGIYALSGSDLPAAVGSRSASLSMFCGRGREMGDAPWENPYLPRPVPILVDDGGDGTFDGADSIFFFGRGLSWWEARADTALTMPSHFSSRYSGTNRYWLTWGGDEGARMEVLDGGPTGAPTVPAEFLARTHHEQNLTYVRTDAEPVGLADDWAWDRSLGTQDATLYHQFDAPGAAGEGFVRLAIASTTYRDHRFRLLMNGNLFCDTLLKRSGVYTFSAPTTDIRDGENTLAIEIVRGGSTDDVYLDWFEVFAWSSPDLSGQAQLPLEWMTGEGRRSLDIPTGASEHAAFLVGGDTLAAALTTPDPSMLELELPDDWGSRTLWLTGGEGPRSPTSVEERSPGRIAATIDGAPAVYVCGDGLESDAGVLASAVPGAVVLTAREVYDEMNGGVRDPGAIRALMDTAVRTWDPVPENLVLVGGGNWDPRNFVYSRESLIDILYYGFPGFACDDMFAITGGFSAPQAAVSRIAVLGRSDLQVVAAKTVSYGEGSSRGDWQTVVLAAADDERTPLHNSDEVTHTRDMETLMRENLPGVMRPRKMYLIFYDFNDLWKKPEARADYIDMWSDGALLSLFLGHGGYDQIADEGLLYLEDAGQLACEGRLPFAIFGSCNVGEFQNPSQGCLGQQVITVPGGGALISMAATAPTGASANRVLMADVLDEIFGGSGLTLGMQVLAGKMRNAYTRNDAMYSLFGDGNVRLAYPGTDIPFTSDTLRTGEAAGVTGTAPEDGLVMVEAFESCRPDSYYTFRQYKLIEYLSEARPFYRGLAAAGPDFDLSMFVPVDADTGSYARVGMVHVSGETMAASSDYPAPLVHGSPTGTDSVGPDIELWLEGHRGGEAPEVSGDITVRAVLSDESGIDLLGNPGRQLALYTDGVPEDVSDRFTYYQGSGTAGELTVELGTLEPGTHELELRAADGALNLSSRGLTFSVTQSNDFVIDDVFPYPNPCPDDGVSINWSQTAPGRVRLSVYTLGGRRILDVRNLQGVSGYNQHWWDCRDADGDHLATGSYIFMISSEAESGSGSEATGVIALVRDSEQ